MDWSLGEAKSMSVKAARGGGFPWGLAEEAGFAVVWLESRGMPGLAALADLLDAREAGEMDEALCPLTTGSAISDDAGQVPTHSFEINQPLLLLPFLAVATGKQAVQIGFNDAKIKFSQVGVSTANSPAQLLCDHAQCTFEDISNFPEQDCTTRISSSALDAVERLTRHAHKTYAPATEQSRLAGAGAGTSDND